MVSFIGPEQHEYREKSTELSQSNTFSPDVALSTPCHGKPAIFIYICISWKDQVAFIEMMSAMN